jgi:8-oxo-dGTP pyrophosphatase MutT (NUDIX family)
LTLATPIAGEGKPARKKLLIPRDAATLILVKRDGPVPAVLMGHRSARHVFMPNTFVFPGGRVDPEDRRIPVAAELRPEVAGRLKLNATPSRSRSLALAAIRECYEETGLMLGRPIAPGLISDLALLPESWRGFFGAGLAPALDSVDFVFRAITPPGDVRRFHARFFLAEAAQAHGEIGGSGELLDLQWLPIPEALATPNTPGVTKHVLREVQRLLDAGSGWPLPHDHMVPLLHGGRGGEMVRSVRRRPGAMN